MVTRRGAGSWQGRPGIVLSGYYGLGNAGDEAILEAIIADLRALCPDVDLTVLSAQPDNTASAHGVRAVQRFSAPEVWRALGGARLLISGGGSLLQDVTSSRSLWYYLAVLAMAKLRGLRTMVYANGLGPIRGVINRWVSGAVLRRADLITLRDPDSARVLAAELGVRLPSAAALTADPAFGLRPLTGERRLALLDEVGVKRAAEGADGPNGRHPVVGLALRPWPGSGDLARRAAESVVQLLRDERDGSVLLIPMQHTADVGLMSEVQAQCRDAGVEAHLASRPLGPREALTLVSACDLVVAMRLHALIFAASAGVPLVAISYDPKIASLIEYLADLEAQMPGPEGGPARGGVLRAIQPVTQASQLAAVVGRAWRDRAEIARALRAVGPELRRRARANAEMACELLGPHSPTQAGFDRKE
jgi:polysaccharide pyruvyl transferase CsaB